MSTWCVLVQEDGRCVLSAAETMELKVGIHDFLLAPFGYRRHDMQEEHPEWSESHRSELFLLLVPGTERALAREYTRSK